MRRIFCGALARLLALVLVAATGAHAQSSGDSQPPLARVTLPGHVLPALTRAAIVGNDAEVVKAGEEPLNLTVVLRRTDPEGFEQYLASVYDADSHQYRKFLSPTEIADRFGPTQQDYEAVRSYFSQQGFEVLEESANRLTLTFRALRADTESALSVRIRDYKIGERTFHANDANPQLPANIAARVEAIAGLTNAGVPATPIGEPTPILDDTCKLLNDFNLVSVLAYFKWAPFTYMGTLRALLWFATPNVISFAPGVALTGGFWIGFIGSWISLYCTAYTAGQLYNQFANPGRFKSRNSTRPQLKAVNSQKIGLLEFDTFHRSDVQDWLALSGADPSYLSRLTQVAVNGGVASPGAGESEVLLDIVTVMAVDQSPNTHYVVYHAPANTSWQQMFNAMINDGVTVISNSWSDCEDQHTLADVQSIDAVLAAAAASGISVFNGSGDKGSTCLDGSPNTVGVPASSPHATAVGGTTPLPAQGVTYGGETWWDGSAKQPPTGQGGFGVSRYFSRPAYQNGLTASVMRSVPDVAVNADPRFGLALCQADAGGCPDGLLHGGTSMAAPEMAIMMANLNEVLGTNVGEVNPVIYPLAPTNAFHSATSMGTDFAHVGLGSPRLNYLRLLLSHQTIGPADPSLSFVAGSFFVVADGASAGMVQVNLVDANGYPVSGKNVTLTPSPGSHVSISAPNGPSNLDNGAVVFHVTDTAIEDVTFTATDATDGVTLSQTVTISFVAPAATSGGITALPSTVAANGSSTTTITVTLLDANGHGAIGKLVTISQGAGHSVLTGPSPAVTDANGQIQFTATDTVSETVTYTAVDVTDGNLPVPGSGVVNFTGGGVSCLPAAPTAANGFTLTPFANGFVAQNFFYANINFVGCPGASNPAFDALGAVFVADFPTGDLYKFGSNGGAVSSANKLSNLGKTFGNVVFGKDGKLYGTTFSPAAVVQVDPATGAIIRTVASGFSCPSGLAVDPLSGDLFFDDNCVGGIQDASVWRVQNPGGASPTVVVYSTLPGFGSGQLAFAPDGTLFAVCCAFNNANAPVLQISGTNKPAPHPAVQVAGITADTGGLAIGEVLPNGAAKSLIVNTGGASGGAGGALKMIELGTLNATVLANGLVEPGVVGPDGCMYVNSHDTILKLAPTSGGCGFNPTNPSPALVLTPASVSPNPAQGSARTFTATFANVAVPAGTPVEFLIIGANHLVKLADTDANGTATISYTGVLAGSDTVIATASLGGSLITSNPAQLTWTAGKHVAFVTLIPSPTTGSVGQPVTLVASLVDISQKPAVAIVGVSVTFTLGNQTCVATTNAQGAATCTLTVPSGAALTLSANFGGNAQFTPASDSELFRAVAALGNTVPGAPTIGAATPGNGQASVSFTAPASNGGSAITSYTAACTVVGGGATVTGTASSSPVIVSGLINGTPYTCTVSAINAQGTGPASAASNVVTPAAAAAAPGAPTIGSATAGPGLATVSFTPPASNGGSPITTYTVTCTGGGGSVTGSGPASPILVSGLTGGVTYTCSVTATNASGTSAPSGNSNAVLVLAVVGPQMPVNIPTLSDWMLLLLAASLLVIGAGALRVRSR